MKVFLDTNIVIDYVNNRGEFYKCAMIIVQLAKDNEIELYASDLTFVTVSYLLRKVIGKDSICSMLKDLRAFIKVLGIGCNLIDKSIEMQHKDFEDCVQYNCAVAGGMDYIVTRNIKDFEGLDEIKVYSPTDFLDFMNVEY